MHTDRSMLLFGGCSSEVLILCPLIFLSFLPFLFMVFFLRLLPSVTIDAWQTGEVAADVAIDVAALLLADAGDVGCFLLAVDPHGSSGRC